VRREGAGKEKNRLSAYGGREEKSETAHDCKQAALWSSEISISIRFHPKGSRQRTVAKRGGVAGKNNQGEGGRKKGLGMDKN